ncbi:WD repeat-containing protein 91 [Drosophila rhopaloa]|uniref:WD repeat-containing protein 91 n=1 Tax=Drosophila rhopaloa TaxID=1041015 RepID=A0A6P4F7R2_DRORH|nr:WD repeat-containing protein 91 [Drosophila rhopaloa]XP_016985099.1 WD repeat-containing protein 91 [Drosophila rhopaloa]
MAQVAFLDNLLREYLVFRGFSGTLKALDLEQRTEKDQHFRAERILDQFNNAVQNSDLLALRSLWFHLDNNIFSKLEHTYAVAVKKLENSLLKYYLVTAYSSNRSEKVSEFFNKMAGELQQQSEWKDWFYFPFCKNAEESPTFALFFTKQWQDTLLLSLRNFLTTVYQCLPQPTFVRAEQEAVHMQRLSEDNAGLRTRLLNLQQELHQLTQQQPGTSASGTSGGSLSGGDGGARRRSVYRQQQSLSDILPFDISPPGHIVDDFCIIASEANSVSQASDAQARGLKLLIRNIGSGSSPVMGRKDQAASSLSDKSTKRRSGSVGRSWI